MECGLSNATDSRSPAQCGNAMSHVLDQKCYSQWTLDEKKESCPADCKEALAEQAALGISKDCYAAAVDYVVSAWQDSGLPTAQDM